MSIVPTTFTQIALRISCDGNDYCAVRVDEIILLLAETARPPDADADTDGTAIAAADESV
jgi:hypothetical protein